MEAYFFITAGNKKFMNIASSFIAKVGNKVNYFKLHFGELIV